MNWNKLESIQQFNEALLVSNDHLIVIFKHSTRCSISAMALSRFERQWADENIQPYYLDLINHRDISNAIAEKLDVEHQSPQVLLIKDGKCIYTTSHSDISAPELKKHIA